MVNLRLLCSTAVIAPINVYCLWAVSCDTWLFWTVLLVAITSFWNHGTTSEVAKIADRSAVLMFLLSSLLTSFVIDDNPSGSGFLIRLFALGIVVFFLFEKFLHRFAPHYAVSFFHFVAHLSGLCFCIITNREINKLASCHPILNSPFALFVNAFKKV